jgi:branched-chain amino acid transport system permease protein
VRAALLAAALGLAFALPLAIASNALLNFFVLVLLFAFLGQAWNVLGGYGGQFSFGHAAFFGTGAYVTAILQVRFGVNAWAALPAAVLAGGLLGAGIGALSFRYGLRGSYFALVTLAFAEILRVLAGSLAVTGGGAGLLIPLRIGAVDLQFASRAAFYWLLLLLVLGGCLVSFWLERSRFGLRLKAVRENEASAMALGVDVVRTKLGAITLSAAMTALAGVLYAQYFLYLDPGIAFGPRISVEALLVPIVGGLGTVLGPLAGSLVVHGLSEATRALMGDLPGLNLVVYGLALLLILRFADGGIVGLLAGRGRSRRL